MNLDKLNKKYQPLSPLQRVEEVTRDFSKILFTSSFGATAVYLIHLFSKANPKQEIIFLDTTFHFPETIEYKNYLRAQFNLNIKEIKGDEWRNQFTQKDNTWKTDPDLCCSVNKVEPLEKIKPNYDVWVSGLMKSQNEHRASFNIFDERNGIIKFYPIIDVTEEMANEYIKSNNLPEHPLKAAGYNSIGCSHCTSKGKSREGRWINKSKTECGLHL